MRADNLPPGGPTSHAPQSPTDDIERTSSSSSIPQMMVMPGGGAAPMLQVVWDTDPTKTGVAPRSQPDAYDYDQANDNAYGARRRLPISPGPSIGSQPPAAAVRRSSRLADATGPFPGLNGSEMRNPAYGLGSTAGDANVHEVDMHGPHDDEFDRVPDLDGGSEEDEEEEKPLVSKRQPPIVHRWNIWPVILFFWFMGAGGYYFYVRIMELNGTYGAVILAIELLGVTSFLPYAILITRGVYPSGSPGLPEAGTDEALLMSPPAKTPFVPRFPAHLAKYAPSGSDSDAPYQTYTAAARGDNTNTTHTTNPVFGAVPLTPGMNYGPGPITPMGSMGAGVINWQGYGGAVNAVDDEAYRFHVRVLVPCYKEPLEVVAATLNAARGAPLPAYTRRTVYLCDDGKDPEKKSLVATMGPGVVYVSGRRRKPGEINGKSANLNNCLKNHAFKDWPKNEDGEIDWAEISNKELIVVFDADMCAKQEFYLRILEVMMDDNIALCLSPQSFHNISADSDLFNNINKQFWECWLPGAFGWGYIACTGTNFCIRARALSHCGWFPDYTITEDYALGMELKSRGYKATYLMLYIAEGEAPEEIRNCFRQRSRWNKGHFQVFFSSMCPLLNMQLPFFQRLWYSYAAWAPLATCIVVPTYMLVPFMSIVMGYNPVTITFRFVLASTLYFTSLSVIQNHAYGWGDWKLMWFANGSNTVLWFTYVKAFINVMLSKAGFKTVAFKVTEKVKTADQAAAEAARAQAAAGAAAAAAANPAASIQPTPRKMSVMERIKSVMMTGRKQPPPTNTAQPLLPSPSTSNPDTPRSPGPQPHVAIAATPAGKSRLAAGNQALRFSTPAKSAVVPITPRKDSLQTRDQLRDQNRAATNTTHAPIDPNGQAVLGSASYVRGADPLPATEVGSKSGWERMKAVLKSFKPANIREFDEMFDPLALFILFVFSAGTFGFGVWQVANTINQRAPAAFDLNSPLKGSPYLIISTVWAFFNLIVPYLFLHYCFSAGKTFAVAAKILMFCSHFVMIISIVLIWLLIPTEFNVKEPLALQMQYYLPSQVAQDTNTNFQYLVGLQETPVTPDFDPAYMQQLTASLAAAGSPGYNSRKRARAMLQKTLTQDGASNFDPVGITDEELAESTGAVADWQRTLLQAPTPDLSGGLLVKDHVKYNQPIAYTITQLAWSMIQFPNGFTGEQRQQGLRIVRAGAEYLMRCLLRLRNGEYVYVAQIGDPRQYLVVDDPANDPETSGQVWTSPQQDPYLNGNAVRKVWLMTGGNVGSDLLGSAAAGLAAASELFKKESPSFSSLALSVADKVYQFASLTPNNQRPKSYCDFVPCQANVTLNQNLLIKTVYPQAPASDPNKAECYYADWQSQVCLVGWTRDDCVNATGKVSEVYKTKGACCTRLTRAGVWVGLNVGASGICALPDDATTCYIPNAAERTCRVDYVDKKTGKGCSGKGLEIYASPEACCNYLTVKGAIDPSAGKRGAGICASITNPTNETSQCYVPSVATATCEIKTGDICNSYSVLDADFGSTSAFRDATSCCNRLLSLFQNLGFNKAGGLQLSPQGICALPDTSDNGRKMLAGVQQRQLLQTDADLWTLPKVDYTGCLDNSCSVRKIGVSKAMGFYNSTSTLDDMAWAGVWMYRASSDTRYLGEAQKYLERHYKEDITPVTLAADREYYVSDFNNLAWSSTLLLAQITGSALYSDRMKLLLNAWVFGSKVEQDTQGLPLQASGVDVEKHNMLTNVTDMITNTTVFAVPTCNASFPVETFCFDGIDNDCDGKIDRDDIDCGFFPVSYTTKQLAYNGVPSLPNTAGSSWLGLVFADLTDAATKRRLRCWALSQAGYMIGSTPDTRSYVVGYRDAPSIVQHRASSCPAPIKTQNGSIYQPTCSWNNAFWPNIGNPQLELVAGALLAGPDANDNFDERRSSAQSQVSMDTTVVMTSLLAGLTDTGTTLRSCELLFGVVQRFSNTQTL